MTVHLLDSGLYVPRIVGLPPGLDVVPHPKSGQGDQWRREHFEWVDEVAEYRKRLRRACARDQDAQQDELKLCANSVAYWAAMWVHVEESRHLRGRAKGRLGRIAIAPYWYQVSMWDWMDKIIFDDDWPDDGFISKSRTTGVSWGGVIHTQHGWLFKYPFDVIYTSRVEDLVDKPLSKTSLFYKFDYIQSLLPAFMAPRQVPKVNRQHLLIQNDWNGNVVEGWSATKQSGVGGRGTYCWMDELARAKYARAMHEAMHGTAEHIVACSTETREVSDEWEQLWHAARDEDSRSVFELEYWYKPEYDKEWEARERKRWVNNPGGFEREYGRDPAGGATDLVYPFARDIKIVPGLGYDRDEDVLVSIDPGRRDACATVIAQPDYSGPETAIVWLDCYERTAMMSDFYAHIYTGEEPDAADPYYGLFNNRDFEYLRMFRDFPWDRLQWFGDPAGKQQTITGQSFYHQLGVKTAQLRERQYARWRLDPTDAPKWVRDRIAAQRPIPLPYGIVVVYDWDRRDFESRRNALRAVIKQSKGADRGGVRRIIEAMAKQRFNLSGLGHQHGESSNVVAACEYLAQAVSIDLQKVEAVDDQEIAVEGSAIYDLAMEAVPL